MNKPLVNLRKITKSLSGVCEAVFCRKLICAWEIGSVQGNICGFTWPKNLAPHMQWPKPVDASNKSC